MDIQMKQSELVGGTNPKQCNHESVHLYSPPLPTDTVPSANFFFFFMLLCDKYFSRAQLFTVDTPTSLLTWYWQNTHTNLGGKNTASNYLTEWPSGPNQHHHQCSNEVFFLLCLFLDVVLPRHLLQSGSWPPQGNSPLGSYTNLYAVLNSSAGVMYLVRPEGSQDPAWHWVGHRWVPLQRLLPGQRRHDHSVAADVSGPRCCSEV